MSRSHSRFDISRHVRSGFTLTELLVVIGVIVILLGFLLPALSGVFASGKMVGSMSNLRQVATWMQAYADDNRDFIVPSQFNYTEAAASGEYAGKVRSGAPAVGETNRGAWTDILWTVNELTALAGDGGGDPETYRYDSPDRYFYEAEPNYGSNPFRSLAANTKAAYGSTGPGSDALPFGPGADEAGDPGYFAANNFFNADPDTATFNDDPRAQGGFWTFAQITRPSDALYAVDSHAGETIEDEIFPYLNLGAPEAPIEVDFRYGDNCLVLFLDGHVDPVTEWQDLGQLQNDRGVRVQKLADR